MLTTEIGTNVQTGLTGVQKPARPVWLTLSKMKLTSQLRSSKCICGTSHLEFE